MGELASEGAGGLSLPNNVPQFRVALATGLFLKRLTRLFIGLRRPALTLPDFHVRTSYAFSARLRAFSWRCAQPVTTPLR
jgi:hypothetical protein